MTFQSNMILVALELSNSLWLVGTRLPGAEKSRMHRIKAGDTAVLLTLFNELRSRQLAMSDSPAPLLAVSRPGAMGFGCIAC